MGHQSSWEKSRTHQSVQAVYESDTELTSVGAEPAIVLAQLPIDGVYDLYNNGVRVLNSENVLNGQTITLGSKGVAGHVYVIRYRSFSGPIARSDWG